MKYNILILLFSFTGLACVAPEQKISTKSENRTLSSSEVRATVEIEHDDKTPPVQTEDSQVPVGNVSAGCDYYKKISDKDLFDLGIKQGVGKCTISDSTACAKCVCNYYLKSPLLSWSGKGWPMNPQSLNSTGCVSQVQWGGYSSDMATSDLIHNGAAQLRHAICHKADPCGLRSERNNGSIKPQDVL